MVKTCESAISKLLTVVTSFSNSGVVNKINVFSFTEVILVSKGRTFGSESKFEIIGTFARLLSELSVANLESYCIGLCSGGLVNMSRSTSGDNWSEELFEIISFKDAVVDSELLIICWVTGNLMGVIRRVKLK